MLSTPSSQLLKPSTYRWKHSGRKSTKEVHAQCLQATRPARSSWQKPSILRSSPLLSSITATLTSSLNPAPISPYTIDSPAWRLLSGTTKGTYNSRPVKEEGQSKMIQMAPSYPGHALRLSLLTMQNTDTKRYWNLTKNIYRFAYQGWAEPNSNSHAHTVDERMVSPPSLIERAQ
jgi:hypothetical protein